MKNGQFEDGKSIPVKCGKSKEYIFVFILLVFSVFFLFYGLGTRYLWQDEAQTPLIAKTILQTGFPYGTDGVNFFSQEGGIEYGHNYLWKWHPWLPFYVEALSIKVLGNSNFAFRFPFAVFGLASIMLVYLMMKRLTGSWSQAAFCAVSSAFSTAFLLLARQCRYYSMEMFFCAGALMFYADYLERRKNSSLVLLFVFMTCIFHTLYVYFFVLLAAFGLHQLLFIQKRQKNAVLLLLTSFFFNLPFIFTLYSINFSKANGNMFDAGRIAHMITSYGAYALKYLFPLFALLLAVMMFGIRIRKDKSTAMPRDITVVLILFVLVTMVLIPVMTPTPFLRNIAGIVIPLALLSGILCYNLYLINKSAGIMFMIIIILSSPLMKFVHEITTNWEEAGECIVNFINANSVPTDEVLITYPDMPLKLYTKLRIHGGLTGEDISNISKPAFVVLRNQAGSDFEKATLNYVNSKLKTKDYAIYQLSCADRLWENREDIFFHDFGPDDKAPRVFIYKLVKKIAKQ